VVAAIITIMVLELPVPNTPGLAALKPVTVLFIVYALSFIKVGIYWSHHHNMLQAARRVNEEVQLANLSCLFWLSLVPFVVRWVGEAGITRETHRLWRHRAAFVSCRPRFSTRSCSPPIMKTRRSSGRRDSDGRALRHSLPILLAVPLAFIWPWLSVAIFVAVAMLWLVPDKRFEQLLD
jgi:uncharacterized membrane protein